MLFQTISKNGHISAKELGKFLQVSYLNSMLTPKAFDTAFCKVLEKHDMNGNELLEYEEFVKFMDDIAKEAKLPRS